MTRDRQRRISCARVLPTPTNKRAIVAGLVVTAVIVGLQAAGQAIDFGVFNLRLRALNSDKHASVFEIASLLAQLAAAAASGWRGARAERARWAWFALGALVACLALLRELATYNASTLAVPLVGVFALVCWLTWPQPGAARAVIWAGLALMVASLLLHEVGLAADASTASDYTWAYQISGIVKHGCELAGWMALATGILAAAGARRRPVRLGQAGRGIAAG